MNNKTKKGIELVVVIAFLAIGISTTVIAVTLGLSILVVLCLAASVFFMSFLLFDVED